MNAVDSITTPRRGGFLKILLLGLLLLVAGLLLLFRVLPSLIELRLATVLAPRSAQIEIASIRPGLSGISIQIARYEEPGIQVHDLHGELPWAGLFAGAGKFEVSLVCGQLSIAADILADEPKPFSMQALSENIASAFAGLADVLEALPISALDLDLKAVDLHLGERLVAFQSELSLIATSAGIVEVALSIDNECFSFDGRLRDTLPSSEIALDFVASASDWEGCIDAYVPELGAALREKQVDLYLDPLAEGTVFADVSGYVRWSGAQPAHVRAVVMGNLGPVEVFWDDLDATFEASSFGMATNGADVSRAYGTLPVGLVQAGVWRQSGGEITLQVNEAGISGSCLLSEGALSLRVSHSSLEEALSGGGVLGLRVEGSALNHDLLAALAPVAVPLGLTVEAELKAEAELVYEGGAVISGTGSARWDLSRAEWPDQGLLVEGFSGEAEVDLIALSGSTDLKLKRMQLSGVEVNNVATRLALKNPASLRVDGFVAELLGGRLKADSFVCNPLTASSEEIRLYLEQIDLEALSKVIPQFDGEISGVVSGDFLLQWIDRSLRVNDGFLELDKSIPAHLSYSTGGLLTAGLAPDSAAYQQYRMAELALEDLTLQRFRIDLFPGGNDAPPILVKFYGESNQSGTIVPVDYTLNVNANDVAGLIQLLQMMQRGELEVN